MPTSRRNRERRRLTLGVSQIEMRADGVNGTVYQSWNRLAEGGIDLKDNPAAAAASRARQEAARLQGELKQARAAVTRAQKRADSGRPLDRMLLEEAQQKVALLEAKLGGSSPER